MAADWALASLIVAIITLVITRELPLVTVIRRIIQACMRWLDCDRAYCDSVVWDKLPDDATFHFHGKCSLNAPGHQEFNKLRYTHSTEDFLQFFSSLATYQSKKGIVKPSSLHLSRRYLHTDVKTLLMCLMSTFDNHWSQWHYYIDSYTASYNFMFERSFLRLQRRADYFEADICAPCDNCDVVTRRTKRELERIVLLGAPPWYRETLKNNHHVEFRFPVINNRNVSRAGWVVAVGLGDADAVPYFATIFAEFHPWAGHHLRGPGRGPYWHGCQYLYKFLCEQIEIAFPQHEVVQVTKTTMRYMLDNHSHSGVFGLLQTTPLEGAPFRGSYTEGLGASDIEFAVSIFNNLVLKESDVDRLQRIILPVLAGCIRGLFNVLEHLNSHSVQLRGDFNVLAAENLPVFVPY